MPRPILFVRPERQFDETRALVEEGYGPNTVFLMLMRDRHCLQAAAFAHDNEHVLTRDNFFFAAAIAVSELERHGHPQAANETAAALGLDSPEGAFGAYFALMQRGLPAQALRSVVRSREAHVLLSTWSDAHRSRITARRAVRASGTLRTMNSSAVIDHLRLEQN